MITNPRIIKFYESNPTIQIEEINLLFVDIFEKVLSDMNGTMTTKIQNNLLKTITENTRQLDDLKTTVISMKESMTTTNADTQTNILSKMQDIITEYIDDLNEVISTNTYEKVVPLIEQNNNSMIDKTNLLLNDIMPKYQTQSSTQITTIMNSFHKSISEDTQQLFKSIDNQSIKEFINNFEMKCNFMLQNVQQPIVMIISACEERINSSINTFKADAQNMNSTLMSEFRDIISTSCKTNMAIQQKNLSFTTILAKMYNSAEIKSVHPTIGPNYILLKRMRKPTILIAHFDNEANISVEEINIFMQLIDEHNYNGIVISQQSGISNKNNYQIDMHNNNVVLFVHNAEHSYNKIGLAVEVVDSFAIKLRHFVSIGNEDSSIPKDIMDSINNEYQLFISQKVAVIDMFKESQKKILSQIDEIRFPILDKFLSTRYSAPIQKPGLKCELCKSFTANNLKALAAHKRGCVRKNTIISPINTPILLI
jgi:hypothetical protein